ncbi:hypothetical protein WH95_02850 [Kiloniella litopenaei]|uniref:Uncharacterized protein n=1 Tax=Kiloniella litopenaei TaxID=1549748 RepID=A0A0M2RE41_9PROT|nr:hypothetical protein [Kiloniella litopenaei]KKJ78270.1 hypothetical protein WH95_02850 [Kiloniella litopenaei]
MPGPDLFLTLIIMFTGLVVILLAGWWAKRPRVPGTIRWVSPTAIQFAALIVIVLMVPHLVGLLGGQDFVAHMSANRSMGR